MRRLLITAQRCIKEIIGRLDLFAGGFIQSKHLSLLRPEPLVPVITIRDLIGNDISLQLTEVDLVNGNISPSELIVIAALVHQAAPRVCFEIGTFDGCTTVNLAANQPSDGHVFTLDLPASGKSATLLPLDKLDGQYIDKPSSGARIPGHQHAKRITQLYGDSAIYDFSDFHDKVNFMFVDGSHSYYYVKSDSQVAVKLVPRNAGLILWHDYNTRYWHGVTRALNELYSTHPEFSGLRHIQNTTLCILQR